jgi:hypothetical protein
MGAMMTVRLGVLYAASGMGFLLLGVGCGGRTERAPELSQLQALSSDVTTLEFTRTTSGQSNPPPPLQVTVDTPIEAQALYQATLSLPEMSAPASGCPSEASVRYQLTFRSGASIVMQAVEEPDGCQRVAVAGVARPLIAGDAYWARLSQGLGVPESIMYPESTLH